MMKRLAATGVLAMAIGGVLGTSPALATGGHDGDELESNNTQGVGIQVCQLQVIIPIISPPSMQDCLNGSNKTEVG